MNRLYAVATVVLVSIGTLAMFAAPAQAHNGEQSYIYIQVFEDQLKGRVEYPISQLNDVLDLDIPNGKAAALAALEAERSTILSYTDRHIGFADGSTEWSVTFDGFDVLQSGQGAYALIDFEVERVESMPRQFTVTYDGIFESDPNRDALLIIESDWGAGIFNNESNHLLRYSPDNTSQVVDLDDSSWWKGMSAVVELGAAHIQKGNDHILFVLALVIPSVLVFSKPSGWEPAPTFLGSLWRVMKIVTMFTLAHSITLILGGLEIINLPSRPVEFLIAISIAAAALHNLRPIFFNREWLMAFGFGLFHGLGFAGLLSDLGLDRTNRVQSLLGFNLGIEFGQAIIILLLFPVLFLLRRTRYYMPLFRIGSIALAIIATLWGFERAFDRDLNIDSLISPVVVWPRVAGLMLGFLAIAAGIYWFEKRADRLVPLEPQAEPEAQSQPGKPVAV